MAEGVPAYPASELRALRDRDGFEGYMVWLGPRSFSTWPESAGLTAWLTERYATAPPTAWGIFVATPGEGGRPAFATYSQALSHRATLRRMPDNAA